MRYSLRPQRPAQRIHDPLIADKNYSEAAAKLKVLANALDGTSMAGKVKAKLNEADHSVNVEKLSMLRKGKQTAEEKKQEEKK